MIINNKNMAQRRMFSPDIICSEEFLDMPPTSRDLYMQLAIRADDDGFIQPKSVMRILGSAEDDQKILIAKRFIIPFDTGVVVIKHWLIHNMIRQDRYKPTRFAEEKNHLKIKENKAYTEKSTAGLQNGNQMATQVRVGEVRVGKFSLEYDSKEPSKLPTPSQQAKDFFTNEQTQFAVVDKMVSSGKYRSDMVLAELPKFISYWTEPLKNGKGQRWQDEKAFEVVRRLATWLGRNKAPTTNTRPDYYRTGGMTKAFDTCGKCVGGLRDGHVCSCVRPLHQT